MSKYFILSEKLKGSPSLIISFDGIIIKVTNIFFCFNVENGTPYSQVTLLFVLDDISSVHVILVFGVKIDWSASLC